MSARPTTYLSERARAAAEELRIALKRTGIFGAAFFAALVPFDFYIRSTLYPEASPSWIVASRLIGTASFGIGILLLRRRGWSVRALVFFSGVIVAVSVTGSAGLALELGGLNSLYNLSLAFYGIALGTFLPNHWARMTAMLLPGLVAYYATVLLVVATSSELAPQLADPLARANFIAYVLFVLGLSLFAIASGHANWRARTSLQDSRRLGRYRLKSLIGQGGMNEVWLAVDTTLKREVALKLLRSHHAAEEARKRRFISEARATSVLVSPHTVRLFDYGANEDGTAWIVMEYLRGQDIAELIERGGPIAPRRAVHFARQAAASLAEAHEHGIVHRDVKPANLFALSQPGQEDFVKLLDFGIARQLHADEAGVTLVGTFVGTPAFMAPEQLAGAADARSDVFALGATLYVMLSGRLPFELGDHYTARTMSPPALPSALPPGLDALVMGCMAPEPAERPANGAALLAALDALGLAPWSPEEAKASWAEAKTAPGKRASTADEATTAPRGTTKGEADTSPG